MAEVSSTNAEIGIIRLPALIEATGFSGHTIKRWVKEGSFPKPFQLVEGGPDVWRVKDVAAFIAKRRRSRQPKRPARGALKKHRTATANA